MTIQAEEQLQRTYFDRNNPHSIVNRVWSEFLPYLQAVADVYSKYLGDPENVLKAICKPDERDIRARLSFWDEYNLATQENRLMDENRFMSGIMTTDVWQRVYLTNRKKLLWILCQPANYTATMRYLLDVGLKRLQEIMEMPLVAKNGKPDIRMISQVLKAFQLVDLRVKGSVLQRMQIDQRSLNVHVGSEGQSLNSLSLEQLREMESQLERIEKKRDGLVGALPPDVKASFMDDTCIDVPMTLDTAEAFYENEENPNTREEANEVRYASSDDGDAE